MPQLSGGPNQWLAQFSRYMLLPEPFLWQNWDMGKSEGEMVQENYSLILSLCHHHPSLLACTEMPIGTNLSCTRMHTANLSPSGPNFSFCWRNVLLMQVLHTFRKVEKAYKSIFSTLWHWLNARVVCIYSFNLSLSLNTILLPRVPWSALWTAWRCLPLCNQRRDMGQLKKLQTYD